jgi:hypothetical protein
MNLVWQAISKFSPQKFFLLFNGRTGRSTIGEYFDPAYDCSDVVDRVPAAKSGVYWIENEAVIKVVKVSFHI